jgi:hypothetical protein
MRKQKNKRGKVTRKHFVQTVEEAKWNYKDKPNPRYPGRKTIVHELSGQ